MTTCPMCSTETAKPLRTDNVIRELGRQLEWVESAVCETCYAEIRLDALCRAKGFTPEDITVESNEGAPDGYGYGAWVGQFELGCKVGTGRTPEAAIEDLLDMLYWSPYIDPPTSGYTFIVDGFQYIDPPTSGYGGGSGQPPAPQGKWHMVTCKECGLLVGWTREPLKRPFYCIPCFDRVAHLPEREKRR